MQTAYENIWDEILTYNECWMWTFHIFFFIIEVYHSMRHIESISNFMRIFRICSKEFFSYSREKFKHFFWYGNFDYKIWHERMWKIWIEKVLGIYVFGFCQTFIQHISYLSLRSLQVGYVKYKIWFVRFLSRFFYIASLCLSFQVSSLLITNEFCCREGEREGGNPIKFFSCDIHVYTSLHQQDQQDEIVKIFHVHSFKESRCSSKGICMDQLNNND